MSSTAPTLGVAGPDDLGPATEPHPRGLYVLFGAEMWERFSYYGMRALLVLYLMDRLSYSRDQALSLYGTYTGLVYLTPLLGGYLADRYLGQRKAVFLGGMMMALGHFAMAFEPMLFLALGLLILGNGFFKPNISTMVGQLYSPEDRRRDSAYTIFYMGINTGAFLAPLICGYLGESKKYGWHYGFAAAGVGMVLGLINFAMFQKTLGNGGFPPGRAEEGEPRLFPADFLHVILLTAVGCGLVFAAVALSPWIYRTVPGKDAIKSLVVLAYYALLSLPMIAATALIARGKIAPKPPGEDQADAIADAEAKVPFTSGEWQRIGVILVVAVFSIVFWMGFEQAGGTFTLFAKEKTERAVPAAMQATLGEKEFPASLYQSINPLLIVLLAPLPLILWNALERRGLRVNSAAKMGLGLVILGLGFIVMNYIDMRSSPANKAGPQWLVFVYLFNTIGELCLSPIGLSLVNKLSPARIASLMMATWFLCTAIANKLAAQMESILADKSSFLHGIPLFTFLIWTSIGSGVLLLMLNPLLKKMGHGRI